ncbi:J domain-containing protein [Pelagibius sp. Alg239-R121]|uniref:J domain-containing protein n=1 Tax=Pelagibius sp. Alg239-R121 TaxID=2993448 RepID=UPI0024A62D2F|nr:J domain-containing protein [Pelagibius sp. Alg239-R121]
MKDPYKTLNVAKTASAEEIKAAYRKLAKKLHPDLNPGNDAIEQQFKEVSQAYGILGDAEKRGKFDAGQIDGSGQETPWKGGYYRQRADDGGKYSRYDFGDDIDVGDIFSDLFGGRGRKQAHSVRRKGEDVSYAVDVDFLEAAAGATKRIRLGEGKTLDIRIPPGTENGQSLRLKGQGMAGIGGAPNGDAMIEVSVRSHPHFSREGADITLDLPVSLQEAVLGAAITVPTVAGKVTMKIPPGSNSGSTLRLKGKGVPGRGGKAAGDQFVKLRVMLPDTPDEELQRFVETWSKNNQYDPRGKADLG